MLDVAIVSEIGRREVMEDTYSFSDLRRDGLEVFGGAYDGHGGKFAAEYTRDNLPKIFFRELARGKTPEPAFKIAYEEASAALADQESGTTAVNFYLKHKTLFYANVGDTRLIVIADSGVKRLSRDHRVDDWEERKRILESGGQIEEPYVVKGLRGLMTTRSLGDEYFRDVGIISTPATGRYKLQAEDKWILAATDGLFDFMADSEVARLLKEFNESEAAAQALKEEVLVNREGSDNLTLVLLKLKEAGERG